MSAAGAGGRRVAIGAVVFVGSTLAVMVARELSLGAAAVAECDAAIARGDLPGAVDAARAAAEATAPASPYPERGYARLEAIAQAAETRGDEATAGAAWRAARAATMATRTPFGPPLASHARDADLGLARLAARPRSTQPEAAAASGAAMLAALARDDRPSPWGLLVLGLGAVSFFAGVVQVLRLPPGATRRDVGIRATIAAAGLAVALVVCLRS